MLENIRLSLQGILSHKVRSILTMLGIIIGIAAIIAIVSTIKGTNEQIKNNLIGSGNNTVNVQLYQGESPYDFSYQAAPDGVQVVSAEVRDQITSLKNVESATMCIIRTPSSVAPCMALMLPISIRQAMKYSRAGDS